MTNSEFITFIYKWLINNCYDTEDDIMDAFYRLKDISENNVNIETQNTKEQKIIENLQP